MAAPTAPAPADSPSPDIAAFLAPIPRPYAHQTVTTDEIVTKPAVFVMSDPGTGKTRAALDAIAKLRADGWGKALIVAPKAILQPAWGNDCDTFTPHLSYVIANAANRAKAFAEDVDIYITNHDAVKWLVDHPQLLLPFNILIIDESTAFKHRTSQRSKALASLRSYFNKRVAMTGTPTANNILDIWHQVLLLDDGQHLGANYFKFCNAVCAPVALGFRNAVEWHEKPGAREAVADLLSDITVRHTLEDCIDIPPNTTRQINFTLSPAHEAIYTELLKDATLELEDGSVNAVHAAALATKLLQVASGSVYGSAKQAIRVAPERYELVIQLIEERDQCLVAFNWKHQRDILVELATKAKLNYAVIDGDTSPTKLTEIVSEFQRGHYRVLFAQPQSASHGLTLTKGTTTIWVSPTYDAERFQQFNRRIYRAGQTRKTETILIAGQDTIDEHVYGILTGRLDGLSTLLGLLKTDMQKKETTPRARR